MRSLEKVRDLAAESLFGEKMISSTLADVPLSQIVSDDKRFQVREAEGGVEPEHLERIVEAIAAKSWVPAIVVWRQNGKLVLINGRHRYEAYRRLGLRTIPAYILSEDTHLSSLKQIAVMGNEMHGRSNTGDGSDRLALKWAAQEVIERIHASPTHSAVAHIKDVSSAYKVDGKKLKKEVARLRAEMALEFAGFRGKLDCAMLDGVVTPAIQSVANLPQPEAAEKLLNLAETLETVRNSTSLEPRRISALWSHAKNQPAEPGEGDLIERFQKKVQETCAIAVTKGLDAIEPSPEEAGPAKASKPPAKVKASALVDALAKALTIAKALDPYGVAPEHLDKISEYSVDLRNTLAGILEFNMVKVEG